jgi:glyoxylase-like metal-dependent hydrolase (beta-lactamase superfamily II)
MTENGSLLRPRNILLLIVGLFVVGGLYFAGSEDAQRSAKLRAAEVAGDIATRVVAANSEGGGHAADFISIPIEVRKLNDFVYQARGVGNTHLIATSEGHVVFDTGMATQAAKQRRLLGEAVPAGRITHVIVSHSHQDHAGGAPFWIED